MAKSRVSFIILLLLMVVVSIMADGSSGEGGNNNNHSGHQGGNNDGQSGDQGGNNDGQSGDQGGNNDGGSGEGDGKDHPGKARCKVKKYKLCYNQEYECSEYCPSSSCTVDCASCKPICTNPVTVPPPSPPSSTTPTQPTPPPPPPTTSTPPPPSLPTPSPPSTSIPPSAQPSPPSPTTPSTPPTTSTPPPAQPSPPSPTTPSTPPTTSTPPTAQPSPPSPTTPSTPPPTTSTPPPEQPSPPSPTTPSSPPTTSTPPSPPIPLPSPPTSTSPPPPTSSTPPTPSTPSSPSPPAPSTPSPSPPLNPPPTPSTSPVKAKCKVKEYTHCYNTEHVCPSSCPGGCEVDCVSCKPVCKCDKPGAVCQDPRFVGGDGITFYFHGKKDRDFCLVSDSNLHINAHFIGKHNHNMRRDFTWVQSIGILFNNHQFFIGAQKTATWHDSVDHLALAFNGEPIFLPEGEGAKWHSTLSPSVSITRSRDTNDVTVEVEGKFKITATVVPITELESRVHNYGITQEDCFAHLDLSFKFYSLSDDVNGVLGQTYRSDYTSRVKMGISMPVLGGDREFASSSIFATDCAVAKFSGGSSVSGGGVPVEMLEYASLSCASGVNGRGVVCKR